MALRRDVALVLAWLAVTLVSARPVAADWPPEGRLLCSACWARYPRIAPDAAAGAFICWGDRRNGLDGSNDDLFLQRILPSGELAPGWPTDGLPVCTDPSILDLPEQPIVADGSGGVFLAWSDFRHVATGGTSVDVYVQHILADGSLAPGWVPDGVPATRAAGYQFVKSVLADGAGGVYVTWDSQTPDVYLQHLGPDGQVAPGWPVNGLPVCVFPGEQGAPQLAADGAGGVFIVWADLRDGPIDAYVQRVTAAGQIAPGWPENGRRVATNRARRGIMPDGAGGAFLSLATIGSTADDDYYLLRFTAEGALAPGWPEGGVPVCLAPDDRYDLRMVADAMGGVLLSWYDYRFRAFADEIFALRIGADGSRQPGWPLDGLRVTQNPPFDSFPDLAADGLGGMYLAWEWESNAQGFDRRVVVQHLSGDGSVAPGWPANGLFIPTVIQSGNPRMVADGMGGAIVAWEDISEHVRALRLAPDGPVPVLVSLASAEPHPGLVRLIWYAAAGALSAAQVERRTEASEWEALASITADGGGRLSYEDRTVMAGTRYGYRLAWREGSDLAYSADVWVEVPAMRFALRGLSPNPSAGDPVVTFTLAEAAPASIELYDLGGRLILFREVGSLGVGTHSIRLAASGRLPAGVYAVRLRQGPDTATARAVFVR